MLLTFLYIYIPLLFVNKFNQLTREKKSFKYFILSSLKKFLEEKKKSEKFYSRIIVNFEPHIWQVNWKFNFKPLSSPYYFLHFNNLADFTGDSCLEKIELNFYLPKNIISQIKSNETQKRLQKNFTLKSSCIKHQVCLNRKSE